MNLPQIEEKILKFWDKKRIFKKSISQRKGGRFFSFYDGPPFATGLPHYGHILATTIKDTVTRYFTMRGFRVERRVGWDCHGLPIENLIEKELGLKSKKDIEKIGIKKFNQVCQASVFRCMKEWVATLRRVGRWADYRNAYATMDKDYIESVWWVFKRLHEMGLVYQAYRVTPYCPRCGTPLSNFELNQPDAYRDIEDQSIFLKFPIRGEKGSFFLVWTTTPWTLPANTALAVGENISYVKIKSGEEKYILAKDRLDLLGGTGEVESEFLGGALVGREYEPLYPMNLEKPGWRVVAADFVSVEEGTGIVHIAPSFGVDDMELGQKENLPSVVTVDLEGRIKKGFNLPGEGRLVKEADELIKTDLKKRQLIFREEKITHSYPFCWRCGTPLLYYPLSTWYIAASKIKNDLVSNNRQIHWVPAHLKYGRFGKWLEGVRDWAVSRNRFWGAPIPIWICQKCGQIKVVGSVKDLGKKISNLHRPYIDSVKFKCPACSGEMVRTEEVFDCWFESGSMPYAQWHYPFENKKLVEETFPADFIAEGVDQTRGWFYTLHVLATALTENNLGLGQNKPAFKNAIVNGLILDETGKKLSKSLKNYTLPDEIIEKFGADTLRFFLLTSTPIGEDYLVSDRRIEETYRQTISTLWHTFSFFKTYTDKSFKPNKNFKPQDTLDRWIFSRLNSTTALMIKALESYDLTDGGRPLISFVEDLSNWYVRRSRRRFQKPSGKSEKNEAAQTLYQVLLTLAKLAAPFIPFLSEEIYLGLKKARMPESVHLTDYPAPDKKLINKKLEEKMTQAREIVALVLAQRASAGIKVRQPLAMLKTSVRVEKELIELVKDEVNVKEIIFDGTLKSGEVKLDTKISEELRDEGLARDIVRYLQDMRKEAGLTRRDAIFVAFVAVGKSGKDIFAKFGDYIKTESLAREILSYDKKDKYLLEKEMSAEGGKIKLAIKLKK